MFKFTRNQLIAAYCIVGLALVGMVVLVFRTGATKPSGGVRVIDPGQMSASAALTPATTDQTPLPPPKLCVHVAGKVKTPGVYELDPGSRIKDAVKAAGGSLPNADLDSINLAEKLEDGQQIYIAAKGQVQPPALSIVRGGESSKPKAPAKGEAGGKGKTGPQKLSAPGQGTVNINSAGLEDLQRLPGIGPAYAQRIIDYRVQHGRFQSIDELDEVKGIGPKKLEKLRPFVSL
jgi:competence protein ComEA